MGLMAVDDLARPFTWGGDTAKSGAWLCHSANLYDHYHSAYYASAVFSSNSYLWHSGYFDLTSAMEIEFDYRICGRNAGRISGRTIQNKGGQIMIWVAIFISGILTFMMRFAFIGSLAHRQIPPPIRSMLSYVSTAVLTAIIVSDVLIVDTVVSISDNPKIPALILAGIAALLFRNVMITISIGLVTLWGLNTYF